MTKMIKMSLIAAVAVTGMTSVVSAKPLEEAIKGVDASGYVTYRYDDTKTDNAASTQENTYKAGIKLVAKVTDDVKVTVNTSVRAITADTAYINSGGTTTAAGDANPNPGIAHASFTYTGVQGLTLTAGKQPLNTPWTEGSSTINPTQAGTGVLGMYATSVATFAAGHFVNSNIKASTGAVGEFGSADLTVLAAIVPVAGLGTAQAWYINVGEDPLNVAGFKAGATAYSLNLAGKASMVDFDARYSALESEDAGSKTNSLFKMVGTANLGVASVTLGYGSTGKDGGRVALDTDGDAGFSGDQVDLNGLADSSAILLSVGANVSDKVNVSATYLTADLPGAAVDPSEMYVDVKYTAAKNLYASVKFGVADSAAVANKDTTHGRLEIGFTF